MKVLTGNSIILDVGKGEVLLATKLGERLVEDVLMRQGKRIVCEGDGLNKAIYVDLVGRNEVRPLGGSMKETGKRGGFLAWYFG